MHSGRSEIEGLIVRQALDIADAALHVAELEADSGRLAVFGRTAPVVAASSSSSSFMSNIVESRGGLYILYSVM